jgi:hypothetical protein
MHCHQPADAVSEHMRVLSHHSMHLENMCAGLLVDDVATYLT